MDVQKTKTTSLRKKPWVLLVAVGSLALVGTLVASPSHRYKIEKSTLLFGEVKRGDLQVTVDGYGVLRSDKQKLISALSAATVEEVVLKPGAVVKADDVILRLSDPELLQDIEAASMASTMTASQPQGTTQSMLQWKDWRFTTSISSALIANPATRPSSSPGSADSRPSAASCAAICLRVQPRWRNNPNSRARALADAANAAAMPARPISADAASSA